MFSSDSVQTGFTNPTGAAVGIDIAHLVNDIVYQPVADVLPVEFLSKSIEVVDWILSLNKRVYVMFDGLVNDSAYQTPIVDRPWDRANDSLTAKKLQILLKDGGMTAVPAADTMTALFMALMRHYKGNNNVLVMRAPFYAWSQLAVLLKENQIGDVIGPLEMFLFPCVKRVLLRWIGGEMTFMDEQMLRNQFGSNGQSPLQIVRQNSDHRYIKTGTAPYPLYSPVYTLGSGTTNIQFYTADNIFGPLPFPRPSAQELNSTFGLNIWRSNRELMVHMSYGFLPVAVVRAIVYGERQHDINGPGLYLPLTTAFASGDDENEQAVCYPRFKLALSFMHPLLVQIVYQVVDRVRPTNPNSQTTNRPPEIKLDEWELTGWRHEHLPYWLTYLHLLGTKARQQAPYEDIVAAHFAVRLKVLDLMGYFTHAMSTDSPDDSGLSSFAWALKRCKYTHACAGVLFIEACRTQMLNGESLLVGPGNVPDVLPAELGPAMLGARIMSLMRLRRTKGELNLQPWNMNIIAFSNLARLSFNVLQQLNLVMAFNTMSNRHYDISAADLFENLIFNEAPTPHMGFIAYHIFTEPSSNMKRLQNLYPEASHLAEDLKEAAEFFRAVYEMAEAIRGDDSGILVAQLEEIKNAYKVCSEKLRNVQGIELAEVCPDMSGYVHVPDQQ